MERETRDDALAEIEAYLELETVLEPQYDGRDAKVVAVDIEKRDTESYRFVGLVDPSSCVFWDRPRRKLVRVTVGENFESVGFGRRHMAGVVTMEDFEEWIQICDF